MIFHDGSIRAECVICPVLAFAAVLSGCGGSSASEKEFLPLLAGDQWEFLVEGAVKSRSTTISVQQRFVSDGKYWFGVEPLLGEFMLVRNADRGVVYSIDCSPYDFDECVDELGWPEEGVLYRYPAERGERYGYLDWPDTTVTVLGDRQVAVPAGTFDCVMFQFDLGGEVTRHCIAPGIGIVWIQETWPTAGGAVPVVLKRQTVPDQGLGQASQFPAK